MRFVRYPRVNRLSLKFAGKIFYRFEKSALEYSFALDAPLMCRALDPVQRLARWRESALAGITRRKDAPWPTRR